MQIIEDWKSLNIDEIIDYRKQVREGKNYALCDEIRTHLDTYLVFIFDAPWGQETYYLTEVYFKRKPADMTNRKYVEKRIYDNIRSENSMLGWFKIMYEKIKAEK